MQADLVFFAQTLEVIPQRGYAAFALAYFRYEDLPPKLEAIPLEYFGHALTWMMKLPEISSEQLGVMGTSRGGDGAAKKGVG